MYNSATLIDNILINQFNGQVSGGNIVTDISDHFSQFCLLPLGDVKVTKMSNRPKYNDFSSFLQDMFLHDLNQISWDSTDDVKDVDKLFSSFFSKVNPVISKHAVSGHLATREFRHQLTRHQEKVVEVN